MNTSHPYLHRVKTWASGESLIRALVVTGSLARSDGSTDVFSDLDVQVITPEGRRYTDDDTWLDDLGEVWIRFPLRKDAPYRLVWFAGGVKVDFQFIHPDRIRALTERGALSDEYQRGYRVVLDKDNLYRKLPSSPRRFPAPAAPSPAEVEGAINEFWFEAIHVAQFIRRREFWVVKRRDWTMKEKLLQLLEWHARSTGGAETNTWLLGKRISEWADEESQKEIARIWPGWDAAAMWRGLLTQIALFRRLSQQLTRALRSGYDDQIHQDIEAYIRRLRADDVDDGATNL